MGEILVGTASWTDRTLLASGWYPPEIKSAADRLAYYADQFPLVEVDSTYYTPPNERNSELWVARTPASFRFHVKAFSLLTQHPTKSASLYKDLRPETDKKNIYLSDLPPDVVDEVWDRFLSAIEPLHAAGRLGAILFQFPPWFPAGERNRRYILECKKRCEPMPICVEFRHGSWMNHLNTEPTLDFLRSYAVPYVCVDMPQGYPTSIPPVLAVTGKLAVVRFHGHSDKWTSRDIYERFGYLYSADELRAWAPRLRELAATTQTHVLMNNCYRDYAQLNARQLATLLTDKLR
ncbi:MAG: DUF72 domain-containing protein [Frankiaceae bacterium]